MLNAKDELEYIINNKAINISECYGLNNIFDIDSLKKFDELLSYQRDYQNKGMVKLIWKLDDYYDRTIGKGKEEATKYLSAYVDSYINDNFTCGIKYFPELENNCDTGEDIEIDKREYKIFLEENFKIFKAVIDKKIPLISFSHNIVLCKDQIFPASLSKKWHDILRNELNYSGLIITDDINMEAIKKYSNNESIAVLAIQAGNDIIYTSNFSIHYDEVNKAVQSGKIDKEIIDKACRRIISWKLKYLVNNKNENVNEEETNEIFGKYYNDAEKYMMSMTIEEKISQIFFPRFSNLNSIDDIKNLKPGGIIFSGKDFNNEEQYIKNYIDQMQNLSIQYTKLPLGLVVDEKGGIENRISTYHRIQKKSVSSENICGEYVFDDILKIEKEKRELLKKFYLNINLVPVADKSFQLNNYIYLYYKGIKYEIDKTKIKGVFYSQKQIDEIIKKYKINNPIYKDIKKKKLINRDELYKFDGKILISEKNTIINPKTEYNNLKILYEKVNNSYTYLNLIKLELLSPNYQKYLFNNNDNNINKNEIPIFRSNSRDSLFINVFEFLKNDEKIYAICGPIGIGKTFTSLIIQKELFKEKQKSIYINLANEEEISELKITLIKELFFLNLEEGEFIEESFKILDKIYNNIWEIINDIDIYCNKKDINYLMILDQYHKEKDPNNMILNLKAKKIFLLSSINDEDVKDNLFNKNGNFNYIYLSNLEIDEEIKEFIKNKDENIKKSLELINYLPSSIFLLDNVFNWNILDFLNYYFFTSLREISEFYKKHNINFVGKLKENETINNYNEIKEKKIITLNEFINNIKDITLKYISYEINSDIVRLFYVFKYAKEALNFEINYYFSRQRIINEAEKFIKGGDFERIILYKFISEKDNFKIDNFIQVNKIVNMDLENEYKLINIDKIKEKNCILINQLVYEGEDYDFAFLYPKLEEIILVQAKYKLSSNNVNNIYYYNSKEKVKIIIDALKKLGINIKTISILYISSVEYNSESTFKILQNKGINCLFYCIIQNYFTSNFKSNMNDYKTLSRKIYPQLEKYSPQYYQKQKMFDRVIIPIIRDYQKNIKQNIQTDLNDEYTSFTTYLKQKEIAQELIDKLGEFYIKCDNIKKFPILSFDFYLFFYKSNNRAQIDYSKTIYIVYEEDNSLVYYNITNKKKDNKIKLKKLLLSDYSYIVGIWNKGNTINLEEKK